MAKRIWAEAGMTIVVLPSGTQGEKLFEIARSWTELKLLAPSVWVKHEWLDVDAGNPPKQKAVVLGINSSGGLAQVDVDLFEQLARQQLLKVRLLAVRSLSKSSESDVNQDRLVDLLDKYVTLSLPLPISRDNKLDQYTTFQKLNLITNPTEFQSSTGNRLVSQRYNANFLASAEDRSAPLAGDAFVRYDESSNRFASFTMMHVATLGALWSGLPVGAFELVDNGAQNGTKSYLSRVFLSAILTDGLARRASTRVLKRAGNPLETGIDFSSAMPVSGTVPILDHQVEDYIEAMVRLTFEFDEGRLNYLKVPGIAEFQPRKVSIPRAVVAFFVFAGDKLVRIPYYAILWAYRKVVRALNKVFFGGSDSGDMVIPEPPEYQDTRDLEIGRLRDSVSAEKAKADAAIKAPFASMPARSTPGLWSNLRDLVFGVLDGSNLSRFGFARSENGWPIFYQVSKLFSDPAKNLDLDLTGDDVVDLQINWSRAVDAKAVAGKLIFENEALKVKLAGPSELLSNEQLRITELLVMKSRLQDLLESRSGSTSEDEKSGKPTPEEVEVRVD